MGLSAGTATSTTRPPMSRSRWMDGLDYKLENEAPCFMPPYRFSLRKTSIFLQASSWARECATSSPPHRAITAKTTSQTIAVKTQSPKCKHPNFDSLRNTVQYCNTTWYKCLSTTFKSKQLNLLKICSKIVGQPCYRLYDSAFHNNLIRLSNNIISDPNHVLNRKYELLPSNGRYRVPRFNKVRLKHPLCSSQSSQ